MRSPIMTCVSLLLVFLASSAQAESEKNAFSRNDKPVIDSAGECVRTKWMVDKDPCAPEPPPPAPKPVAYTPPPPPPPVITKEQLTIYFDFNSDKISPESAAKLDRIAQVVNSSREISGAQVLGFTDQFGSEAFNQGLATRRAEAVRTYLRARRDPASQVVIGEVELRGIGKSEPQGCRDRYKTRNEQIACMAPQRRVEIEFTAVR
jgi:outer membrane protein OmpA-like peptidoglycan-associated protein